MSDPSLFATCSIVRAAGKVVEEIWNQPDDMMCIIGGGLV